MNQKQPEHNKKSIFLPLCLLCTVLVALSSVLVAAQPVYPVNHFNISAFTSAFTPVWLPLNNTAGSVEFGAAAGQNLGSAALNFTQSGDSAANVTIRPCTIVSDSQCGNFNNTVNSLSHASIASSIPANSNFTIMMRINFSESTALRQYLFKQIGTGTDRLYIFLDTGNNLTLSIGADASHGCPIVLHGNNTYHIAVVINATGGGNGNVSIYLNGTRCISQAYTSFENMDGSLFVGRHDGDGNDYAGIMSDFVILNRTANHTEINNTFFGVTASGGGAPPAASPNITVFNVTPETGAVLSVLTMQINASGNFTNDVNCTLYINSTANQTLSILNQTNVGFNYTLNFSNATELQYSYNITCNDTNQVIGIADRVFTIDNERPRYNTSIDDNRTFQSLELNLSINMSDRFMTNLTIRSLCLQNVTNTSAATSNGQQIINVSTCDVGNARINVSICDQIECTNKQYNFSNMGTVKVTAVSALTGTNLGNFTLLIDGSTHGSISGTATYFLAKNLTNATYNFTIVSSGYEHKQANVTVNNTFRNFAYTLLTINSINFSFFDEETLNLIQNVDIVQVFSESGTANLSTHNGSIYLDLLIPSFYTIRYQTPNYTERYFYLNMANGTTSFLELYAVKNSSATEITATVIDELSNNVEDAFVKVLRYDIQSNSYILREIGRTNFEGKTQVDLVMVKNQGQDEFYKFIIEIPLNKARLMTKETLIFETTINFQINLGGATASNYNDFLGIQHNISFNNATEEFTFTYSSSSLILSQVCLEVFKTTAERDTSVNETCSTSSAASLVAGVGNISESQYKAVAKATLISNADVIVLDQLDSGSVFQDITGKMGLFIVMLLTIIAAFVGFWDKSVALIITPLPFMGAAMAGIIAVSPFIPLMLEIIFVIIAIILSRKT